MARRSTMAAEPLKLVPARVSEVRRRETVYLDVEQIRELRMLALELRLEGMKADKSLVVRAALRRLFDLSVAEMLDVIEEEIERDQKLKGE